MRVTNLVHIKQLHPRIPPALPVALFLWPTNLTSVTTQRRRRGDDSMALKTTLHLHLSNSAASPESIIRPLWYTLGVQFTTIPQPVTKLDIWRIWDTRDMRYGNCTLSCHDLNHTARSGRDRLLSIYQVSKGFILLHWGGCDTMGIYKTAQSF